VPASEREPREDNFQELQSNFQNFAAILVTGFFVTNINLDTRPGFSCPPLLVGWTIQLRYDLGTTFTCVVPFLLVPATNRSEVASDTIRGNNRKDLNNLRCQPTLFAIEVGAFAPLAGSGKAEDFRGGNGMSQV
jgi:hypothetical protein